MNNFKQDIKIKLNQIISKLKGIDLSPLMPILAGKIKMMIDENFRFQGRWDGSSSGTNVNLFSGGQSQWVAHSQATTKAYSKSKRGNTPILMRTGVLQRQIEVRPSGKNAVQISVNTPYAAIHQFGGIIEVPPHERSSKKKSKTKNTIERKYKTKGYKIRIPARPYITLTNEDIDEILQLILTII